MKGFLSETEDDKTSPLQNEGMDFEEWELPVKLKKYRKTAELHRVTCTMFEAARESVPPTRTRVCFGPCGSWLEATSPWSELQWSDCLVGRTNGGW